MSKALSILIVDDEREARELLMRGLDRLGFHTIGASDGREASTLLSQHFDIVVTDLMMPHRDGLSLLQELRQRCPGTRRVVITSFGDKERVLACLNAGADYLLEKPFGVQQLAEVLRKLDADAPEERDLDRWFARQLSSFTLTEREQQTVGLVLKGLGNKSIANKLGISEQTVKNSLLAIYQKLRISSRGELFHLVFPI